MKWHRRGAYHLESECGGYRVAKTYHQGQPWYTLWKRPPNGWSSGPPIQGGAHPTPELAKAEAEVAENALAEAKAMLDAG